VFDGQPKEIVVYQTSDGAEPFTEWLRGLRDRDTQTRLRARLNRLETQGNPGDYKAVGSGVYELRADHGPGYRLYCAFAGQQIILLLCGGDKSTQQRDIERAQKFWLDYQKREKR
jgi:putative addiction module killer protein